MADALTPPPGFVLDNPLQPPPGFQLDVAQPRTAAGVLDALEAGWQGSATGLAFRGKLPDVVLDPHHSKWYERALSTVGQIVPEIPFMVAGAIGGGAAGTAALPGPGTIAGTGAGAFAVPAAVRTALVEYYKSDTAATSGGFLASAKIVLKQTAKEAAVGAFTMGAGAAASRVAGSALAPMVGQQITTQTATRAIGAASVAAEIPTLTVSSAALEGRLPEPQEFLDAAIVIGGLKASVGLAHKLGDIYAKTGIPPEDVVAMVKKDPKLGEEIKAETPELPKVFREAANDESARNAILDPDAARAFVEKPFTEVPQAPGEPKVKLNVNYDYINTPDEAKAALARASEIYGPLIVEQTRGKVSWEQTEAEARARLSELTGADARSLLTDREPGTASNAADLLIRRQLLEGAVEDFAARAKAYDAAKSTPEEAIQMLAAAERVAMLSAQFQGAASEAGRALNILQNARATARGAEEVKRLLEMYDRDPAQIAAAMREIDNPVAAAKAAREITKATPMEKFAEAMKAVMISGPISWAANVVGSATFLPLRPMLDAIAVPLGVAREVMTGKPVDRVRAVEPFARVIGNYQGAVDALMAAGSFIRAHWGSPKEMMEGLRELDKMGARKVEVQKRAIEGDLGVFVRSPFLALSVPDRLFRMMIERGEANAIAAREAAKEGHSPFSREFRERMAYHRDHLTDAQLAEIAKVGDRGTFNAELGPKGKAIQNALHELGLIGFIVAPFVRTPLNIAKEMARLTPGAPIIDTWRADIAKGGPAADRAAAEMVLGGSIAAVVIAMADSGLIVGQGETDPNKKRTDLAAGEQPYSFKGGDGKWYEYTRLQPLGTLIGLAADFSAIWDKFEDPQERDKVLKMIGVAFSSAITNQTMLLGLSNLVRAISEPERFFERYVQSLAAMPMPALVSQWSQLNDPYMREIHTVMDAVKNRTPARTTLEPKIDIWGDPIENRERVAGIGPIRKMEPSDDKVKTEAARLNIAVPKTPDHIQMPSAGDRKLGKVDLTPQQQTQYAVIAGKKAHELMEPLVNAPDWDARPDMIKQLIYQRVFEKSREFARAQILPGEQRAEESRRIADEITRRMSTP